MVTPHSAARLRSHWGGDRKGMGRQVVGVLGREGAWMLQTSVLLRLSVERKQFLAPLPPPSSL